MVYKPTFLGLVNCLRVIEASVRWADLIERDAAMGNNHRQRVK